MFLLMGAASVAGGTMASKGARLNEPRLDGVALLGFILNFLLGLAVFFLLFLLVVAPLLDRLIS